MFHQDIASRVGHLHTAVCRNLKCFVVRAVLFRFLRHQAHIGDVAHRGHIKCAIFLAEADDFLVNASVSAVRDHHFAVVGVAIWPPHFARCADGGGHRSVDDDVAGDVQIGDSFVGVDHRQVGMGFVDGLDVCFNRVLLVGGQASDFCVHIAQAVVGIDTQFGEGVGVFLENVFVIDGDGVTEHDGVGHFHHRRFQVQGEERAIFGGGDFFLVEGA